MSQTLLSICILNNSKIAQDQRITSNDSLWGYIRQGTMPGHVGRTITCCNHFSTALISCNDDALTGYLWVSCSSLSHSTASRTIHVARRGSKQGIPFSTMSRSQRRASRARHDSNQRQAGVRQLSIQSVESTRSAKSQA